jgi:small subunit ribosomal protein S8|tara:strand:+ start:236 stop:631 length:396 start_codon:yes stop_codon:yes gene_type:complete
MVNDTISDMLTRIRNANNAQHYLVEIPSTKMTQSIANILKEEGFIMDFQIIQENFHTILISLKYVGKKRKPVITSLERISKPGLRIYKSSKEIPVVLGNLGISILSTSKGIMTGKTAKSLKLGGEILCEIY